MGAARLLLHFAVRTDGTVDEACQSKGTTLPIEIGRCVTERLKELRFPMPNDLHDVELEYRFDFVLPPSRK